MVSKTFLLLIKAVLIDSIISEAPPPQSKYLPGAGLGPASNPVVHAECTIQPGKAPPTQTGILFVQCAASTAGKTGVLRGLVMQLAPSLQGSAQYCDAGPGEWCMVPMFTDQQPGNSKTSSTTLPKSGADLLHFSNSSSGLVMYGSDVVKLPADGTVTFVFRSTSNVDWVVDVVLNGQVVSTRHFVEKSPILGFETTQYCDGCTKPVSPIAYTKLMVQLSQADPNFGKTAGVFNGDPSLVQLSGPPTTNDGGVTWNLESVTVKPSP